MRCRSHCGSTLTETKSQSVYRRIKEMGLVGRKVTVVTPCKCDPREGSWKASSALPVKARNTGGDSRRTVTLVAVFLSIKLATGA